MKTPSHRPGTLRLAVLAGLLGWGVAPVASDPVAAPDGRGKPVFVGEEVRLSPQWPLGGSTGSVTPTPEGALLQIQTDGREALAASNPVPVSLVAGQRYRLTGRVRVERLEPVTSWLFLRARGRSQDGTLVGSARSEPYSVRLGGWQVLDQVLWWTGTATTLQLLVSLTQAPAGKALVEIADLRLVPEPDPAVVSPRWVAGEPRAVGDVLAVAAPHPRFLRIRERLPRIQATIATPPWSKRWTGLLAHLDRKLQEGPAPYPPPGEKVARQETYQEKTSNHIVPLALAWLVTRDRRYLEGAALFMRVTATYPTWDRGDRDGTDLTAGHHLWSLSIGYDWLYSDLDEETRRIVRECLIRRGTSLYAQWRSGELYWSHLIQHNHYIVPVTGLAAAGLALYGEHGEAAVWVAETRDALRRSVAALAPDGTCLEHTAYWSLRLEPILLYAELALDLLDEDLFASNPFFRETAAYRLYLSLPLQSWERTRTFLNFGDGGGTDHLGPAALLRFLAGLYGDPSALWLADALSGAFARAPTTLAMELVWNDTPPAAKPPVDPPLFRHFPDQGLVVTRSGWDGGETVFAFLAGAAAGARAQDLLGYSAGTGHAKADAGTFQIFAHGDLLVPASGRTLRRTEYENCATIDGTGQAGGGRYPFDGSFQANTGRVPGIVLAEEADWGARIVADLGPVYRVQDLLRYQRHVLHLRPDTWAVADEVVAERPVSVDTWFHSSFPLAERRGAWVARGDHGALRLTPLLPADRSVEASLQQLLGEGDADLGKAPVLRVSPQAPGTKTLLLTILEASDAAKTLPSGPTVEAVGGTTTVRFDLGDRACAVVLRPERADPSTSLFGEPTCR